MILLYKNLDGTPNEKDIRIKFLKGISGKLSTIEFSIPKEISCKMSNPNATYLASYSIEFDFRLTNAVWVDGTDIEFLFNNFYLSTQFIINKYLNTTASLTNKWDDSSRIMYIS